MHYSLEAIKPNPQADVIEDLISIATDPKKSRFDKILTTNKDGSEMANDLLEIKGVMLWNNGSAAAALDAFKQIPIAQRGPNRFNPFLETANICVHCNQPDSLLIYNRSGILERIFNLEFQANSDYSNSDVYYYELGLAHFNLSYFGPSWNAMDYFRSGLNWRHAKSDNLMFLNIGIFLLEIKKTTIFQKQKVILKRYWKSLKIQNGLHGLFFGWRVVAG